MGINTPTTHAEKNEVAKLLDEVLVVQNLLKKTSRALSEQAEALREASKQEPENNEGDWESCLGPAVDECRTAYASNEIRIQHFPEDPNYKSARRPLLERWLKKLNKLGENKNDSHYEKVRMEQIGIVRMLLTEHYNAQGNEAAPATDSGTYSAQDFESQFNSRF